MSSLDGPVGIDVKLHLVPCVLWECHHSTLAPGTAWAGERGGSSPAAWGLRFWDAVDGGASLPACWDEVGLCLPGTSGATSVGGESPYTPAIHGAAISPCSFWHNSCESACFSWLKWKTKPFTTANEYGDWIQAMWWIQTGNIVENICFSLYYSSNFSSSLPVCRAWLCSESLFTHTAFIYHPQMLPFYSFLLFSLI